MALDENCIFCKIVSKEIPVDIVFEDEFVLAFNDVNPQAPTHVLIVPRDHIPTLDDLRPEHAPILDALFAAARRVALEKGLAGNGYRVVINCRESAGQSVFHVHMHLLGGRAMRWPPG